MKIAIYPGSFNPWHEGHQDVLNKTLKVFDKVHLVQMLNPEKMEESELFPEEIFKNYKGKISIQFSSGTLKDLVETYKPEAIVKGIRNAQDLEYETCQQYWNEDLGVEVPFFYVITNRNLRHVSSTAKRALKKLEKK